MESFVKGDLVVVPFPFSDLTESKRRPALVLSVLQGDDLILCQITSKGIKDTYAISLSDLDCETGGLNKMSNVRPNRLFTADKSLVLYKVGHLKPEKLDHILSKVIGLLRPDPQGIGL